MTVSGEDICIRALRLLGAVPAGQSPSADDLADAFTSLNDLIDAWRVDSLTILTNDRAVFPLTVGKGGPDNPYTIGPGGDFDRQRPVFLSNAGIITQALSANPIELPINVLTVEQYQLVPVKTTQSALPTALYYDFSFIDGLGRIYFWPILTQAGVKVSLYCPTNVLTEFATPTTPYDFAPAYVRALRFNLAMDLAPDYNMEPSSTVVSRALEYLGDLRRANIKPTLVRMDPALTNRAGRSGFFNYYTGDSGRY